MALKIEDGDYVPNGTGGLIRQDTEGGALLQRVLLRLTAHRGALPFWENFGSRLWLLGQTSAGERPGAAKQYVTEALADEEDLSVTDVTLTDQTDGTASLSVELTCQGQAYTIGLTIR